MTKLAVSIFLALLVAFGTGCSRLQEYWGRFPNQETTVAFAIDDIKPTGQSERITLRGTASLPDQTEVAVSAVRILDVPEAGDRLIENAPYAILDRQFVEIENGRWQTSLTLRQPDTNDVLLENWQLDSDLLARAKNPAQNVIFLAAIEPDSFSGTVAGILEEAVINEGETQLTFTSSGEPYLQVSQLVSVQIPSGTAPKAENSFSQTAYQESWQARSNYNPQVDNLEEVGQIPFLEQDNLPLPIDSFLR